MIEYITTYGFFSGNTGHRRTNIESLVNANTSIELQDILLNAKLVKYSDHSVTSSPIYYKSEAIHSETRGKCFVIKPSREVFYNTVLQYCV